MLQPRSIQSSLGLRDKIMSLDFILVGVKKKWNKTSIGWEDELLFQLLCD